MPNSILAICARLFYYRFNPLEYAFKMSFASFPHQAYLKNGFAIQELRYLTKITQYISHYCIFYIYLHIHIYLL